MTTLINYGFGKEYLSHWGLKEALREIYQNFIDFGNYHEDIEYFEDNTVTVHITNHYKPKEFEFLRIGNSIKHNKDSIGKYGEGLKMAMLILTREGYDISIFANQYEVFGAFEHVDFVGECFKLNYGTLEEESKFFTIEFTCDARTFDEFRDNIITDDDVIFDLSGKGSIVDKDKGNIYSGGLFVTKVDNLSYAYNILPRNLNLDRDRMTPKTFDINYHTSAIKQAYGKYTTDDLSHSDSEYIDEASSEIIEKVEPKLVGNSVEFVYKDEEDNDVVIKHDKIKNSLLGNNIFKQMINALKMQVLKTLGLYDMLVDFKEKHLGYDDEATRDFDLILLKVKKDEYNKT